MFEAMWVHCQIVSGICVALVLLFVAVVVVLILVVLFSLLFACWFCCALPVPQLHKEKKSFVSWLGQRRIYPWF